MPCSGFVRLNAVTGIDSYVIAAGSSSSQQLQPVHMSADLPDDHSKEGDADKRN